MRRLAAGAVALALAATGVTRVARAAAPDRGGGREGDLGEKRSMAPDAALGGTLEAKKPAKKEPGGPALNFEAFRKAVEVQVSDKRREEIASLRRLIELGGGSDVETPQWYFRLAELLWEESQYFFFEANRRDDQLIALGTRGAPREIDRLMAEKRDLEVQQKKLRDQAVALYGAIIKRYPKYPRLDEVLYFLAENLSKRNRYDPDALKAYGALIERFPKSRFVPDAWMALGEYWFEKATGDARTKNLQKALGAYRKAAEYQESSVYGYALYKQGWVHYNLAAWSEALDLFRAVIFFGELPTATVPADRKLALVKEARKDYVRTYSHVGSAEGAAEEFKRVGGDANWVEMLKSLAGIFYEEGKDRDAIVVYRAAHPGAPDEPGVGVLPVAHRHLRRPDGEEGGHRPAGPRLREDAPRPRGRPRGEGREVREGAPGGPPRRRGHPPHPRGAVPQRVEEDARRAGRRVRRRGLPRLPRRLPERARLVRDAVLPRRAPLRARGLRGRRRGVRAGRAAGHQAARDEAEARRGAPQGRQVLQGRPRERGLRLGPRREEARRRQEAGPGGRRPAEAAAHRAAAAAAPRRVPALPQVAAERRQERRDRLQGGAPLLPAQRLRRGDGPLHPDRARPSRPRARRLLHEPRPRRVQPARRLAERERLGEAVLRERQAPRGPPRAEGGPREDHRGERVQGHRGEGAREGPRGRGGGVPRLRPRLAAVAPRRRPRSSTPRSTT